jgi:hypothetical protein
MLVIGYLGIDHVYEQKRNFRLAGERSLPSRRSS